MHPAYVARRAETKLRIEHTEIVAVARADHRAVFAKADGAGIAVNRPMPNLENRHAGTPLTVDRWVRETTIAVLLRKHATRRQTRLPGPASARIVDGERPVAG